VKEPTPSKPPPHDVASNNTAATAAIKLIALYVFTMAPSPVEPEQRGHMIRKPVPKRADACEAARRPVGAPSDKLLVA
jgi:hypothetical protein